MNVPDPAGEPDQTFLIRGIVDVLRVFGDAIAEQSQYAEDHQLRWDRFGGLTMYGCSVYGMSTLFVALVLNRTATIASTNTSRPTRPGRRGLLGYLVAHEYIKVVVLATLRLLAIVLLAVSVYHVLVALSVKKQFMPLELLSRLTQLIPLQYIYYDPQKFAHDKYMGMPSDEVRFGPTSAMLWPIFWSVSYSLFVETFALAINGIKPFLEGGITLFELSLALQEMSSGFFFLRKHNIAKRPSEQVLMVCLFLLADHILGQFGAIFYKNKYRLIPLTFLNVWFVWYFFATITLSPLLLFLFPLNIWFTYVGLVLVLIISAICLCILVLALITKSSNLADLNYASYFTELDEPSEFFSRHLNLSFNQDFYTAALNVGMFAITLAGKSSYITEYSVVPAPRETWLESGIWAKIQAVFGTETTSKELVQSDKVLSFLKENNLSGYGNVVNSPSERLVQGADSNQKNGERTSTIRLKLAYLREIFVRFGQLLWSLVIESLMLQVIPTSFTRYVLRKPVRGQEHNLTETESEFEARKRKAPVFIQHLMTKREQKPETAKFRLDGLSDEELLNQYALILAERELVDVDDSPDFEVVDADYESEFESDLESINLDQGQVLRASGRDDYARRTAWETPMSELMTSDAFIELVDQHDILERHIHHDPCGHGVLTRSKYHALYLSEQTQPGNEGEALLQILLSKRQAKPKPDHIDDDDEDEYLDPRLACVICQVKPREIITWPCKCFAICELCRLSLASKGMEGCVCCRQDVAGVSKVFLP